MDVTGIDRNTNTVEDEGQHRIKNSSSPEINSEINEEVRNNINQTDKLDMIKEFVISAINCRIGNVTNIEGVINVSHNGGETQLIFEGNSSVSSSFDSSKETNSCHGNDAKDIPVASDSENSGLDDKVLSDCDSYNAKAEATSSVDMPSSYPVHEGYDNKTESENVGSIDKMRTFSERLEETLNTVVANYSMEADDTRSERITDHFSVEKNRFALRIDPRDKLKRPKPNKKNMAKRFLCNQCNAEFTALELLCEHTIQTHKTYRCMECNQTFTQRSNLQRHSLKHIGFKPFVCGVCDKGYYRKDHLVRHIEVTHPDREPKRTTKSLISSARCLAFIAFCRREGINPSKCTKLEAFNDFSPYQNRSDDVDVKHQLELLTSTAENSQPESVEDLRKTEENSDNADMDMDVDENDDKASEEQYYEDENGELVLIVEPVPVPW